MHCEFFGNGSVYTGCVTSLAATIISLTAAIWNLRLTFLVRGSLGVGLHPYNNKGAFLFICNTLE